MSRSLKKGPFVDKNLLKKIKSTKKDSRVVIKTWARNCTIVPDMIGFTIGVHNGKIHIPVKITEDKVGHKLGEFSLTRKFVKHGGKIQKELELASKAKELEKSKAGQDVPVK